MRSEIPKNSGPHYSSHNFKQWPPRAKTRTTKEGAPFAFWALGGFITSPTFLANHSHLTSCSNFSLYLIFLLFLVNLAATPREDTKNRSNQTFRAPVAFCALRRLEPSPTFVGNHSHLTSCSNFSLHLILLSLLFNSYEPFGRQQSKIQDVQGRSLYDKRLLVFLVRVICNEEGSINGTTNRPRRHVESIFFVPLVFQLVQVGNDSHRGTACREISKRS